MTRLDSPLASDPPPLSPTALAFSTCGRCATNPEREKAAHSPFPPRVRQGVTVPVRSDVRITQTWCRCTVGDRLSRGTDTGNGHRTQQNPTSVMELLVLRRP